MTKDKLIADLRNKLSPFSNYFSLQRKLNELKLQVSEDSKYNAFMSGYEQPEVEKLIRSQAFQCEKSIAQIEYIIEQLEKL